MNSAIIAARKSPNLLDAALWALTDLMGGGRYDAMIEFYRRLCEHDARGRHFSKQSDVANVSLRAPDDSVTTLFAITGK